MRPNGVLFDQRFVSIFLVQSSRKCASVFNSLKVLVDIYRPFDFAVQSLWQPDNMNGDRPLLHVSWTHIYSQRPWLEAYQSCLGEDLEETASIH